MNKHFSKQRQKENEKKIIDGGHRFNVYFTRDGRCEERVEPTGLFLDRDGICLMLDEHIDSVTREIMEENPPPECFVRGG